MSYDYLIVNASDDVTDLKGLTPSKVKNPVDSYDNLKEKIEKLYLGCSWEKIKEDIFFGSTSDYDACSVEIWLYLTKPFFCIKASGLSEEDVINLGINFVCLYLILKQGSEYMRISRCFALLVTLRGENVASVQNIS